MKLVVIGAYAEGYRSGAIYEEEVVIPYEAYKKAQSDIEELSVWASELDGKHSEVEADIEIKILDSEEKIIKYGDFENYDEGSLYYNLEEVLEDNDIDFEEELSKVREYLKTIDKMTTFEVSVKESQKDEVLKFVKKLNG